MEPRLTVYGLRHEPTLIIDGKKQDTPTLEGKVAAFKKAKARRGLRPHADAIGYHSQKGRTRICVAYDLLGMGYGEEEIGLRMHEDAGLISAAWKGLTAEQKRDLRNMRSSTDPLENQLAIYRMLFEGGRGFPSMHEQIHEAGERIARRFLAYVDEWDATAYPDRIVFARGHGPTLDAAACILAGVTPTYEQCLETTGFFQAGDGFRIDVQDGGPRLLIRDTMYDLHQAV